MKIAALFHVSFEKLGLIEDWILEKGYSLTEYHLYNDPRMPLIPEFDMLIVMGGPMSVNDEDQFPWLASEKELINRCRESEIPVLGICLGAQLIASALGNKVFPGRHTEIGWFPVNFNPAEEARKIFPALPSKATVFHWHGDTFDLPEGAVQLGSSAITPVQAYIIGGKLLALQFHLEVKPENISLMINHAGDELVSSPYIQDTNALSSGLVNLSENKVLLEIFLNYLEIQAKSDSSYGNH
jgi:GMP synthase-like glutamine amidotransferase